MYMSHKAWGKTFPRMINSKKNYYFHRTRSFTMVEQVSLYYLHWLGHGDNEFLDDQLEDFMNRIEAAECALKAADEFFRLGDCKPCTTPCEEVPFGSFPGEVIKQEGNNPMYNTKTSTASADITINATKSLSDEMLQRQYLLDELEKMTRWEWQENTKLSKIKKMFNLDAPIRPKTSAEFLAAITANAYTVNQAKVDAQTKYFAAREDNEDGDDLWADGITNQYYGITFTSLPVEDRKGFKTAEEQYRAMIKTTERTIHIASPADGLAALAAFEAWMPTPATTTVQ